MTDEERISAVEGIDLSRFYTMVRRWWWLIIAVCVITVGVAYAILDRIQPVYRAAATVIVSPKAPRVIADIKEIVDLPGGSRRDFRQYIETQLNILRSQGVAQTVMDKMDLWDDPRLFPPRLIDNADQEKKTKELRLRRAASLSRMIKARRVPDSLTLEIRFEHQDPVLAAQIANVVAETYVAQNLQLKQSVLSSARADLETLLAARLKDKEAAEKRVNKFENKHNITVVGTRRKEVEGERAYYNEKVLEATGKVIAAEAALTEVENARRKGLYGSGGHSVMNNSVLAALKIQYMQVKNEVSELELTYGPKHTKLIGAKKKMGQLKAAARKELKGIYRAARARRDAAVLEKQKFVGRFDDARKESDGLVDAVEEYKNIQKGLTEQTQLYDRIRKRYEETIITHSLAANNVRLLDRALVPDRPIRPRRQPILVGSVFLGLILGMIMAMLFERADTTIRDKTHAEKTVGVPCLGLMPTIQLEAATPDIEHVRTRDLYVHNHPHSEPSEHARTLRTNLLFLSAERQLQTLLVTSPMPEEGKTTIAIQTSIALASAGGRTVLIEADMRRPRLAETLHLNETSGLSTFLADRNADIKEVIQATEIPNLDAIPCGLIPPNPAELLNSLRLNQLIAKLNDIYDMVIIDSPPVNAVSDALVMASRVDGVLLVAKSKRTTSDALTVAYSALRNVDAPVIGTVLNDLHRDKFGYYRRGKYYRKGYYRKGYYRKDDAPRMDEAEALEAVKRDVV